MKQIPINQWAEDDRPREKMLARGAASLSNAELLGILLGSGNSDETAVGLAQRILSTFGNNLNLLGKQSPQELCRLFKGIGPAKAVTVLAAVELGRRRSAEEALRRDTVACSLDIYRLFHPLLADLPYEEFWAIYLNRANKVLERRKIGQGGTGEVTADVLLVLRTAIQLLAPAVVLVHNHPSGNCRPSRPDDRLTEKVRAACQVLDIRLLDHLILSDGTYYSYADEGKI